jgi:trimethylamine--corrinoid protein Co-methyltransferase
MMDDHTLHHFREELWTPFLSNRDRYEAWKEKGAKSVGEKADEKVKKILKDHIPKPLGQDVTNELETMRST